MHVSLGIPLLFFIKYFAEIPFNSGDMPCSLELILKIFNVPLMY